MDNIRIGTLVNADDALSVIPEIIEHGFESFSISFWKSIGNMDLKELASRIHDIISPYNAVISSVSIFTNPLSKNNDFSDAISCWEALIDNAGFFGTDLITGFTGRIPDEPIPESIPHFKKVFGDLSKRAASKGNRLAFENCDMGGTWSRGDWNIAHDPDTWELMFDALPDENIGLQWEPCHQMVSLIDPIPQLKEWAKKIFNVHGKDATIDWDVIRKHGIHGHKQFAWHRTPGFGDSNWTDIISILRMNNYGGSIDIEGYHDPVYSGELELTGQIHALNYLKKCRGGSYTQNPDRWNK